MPRLVSATAVLHDGQLQKTHRAANYFDAILLARSFARRADPKNAETVLELRVA